MDYLRAVNRHRNQWFHLLNPEGPAIPQVLSLLCDAEAVVARGHVEGEAFDLQVRDRVQTWRVINRVMLVASGMSFRTGEAGEPHRRHVDRVWTVIHRCLHELDQDRRSR